jgi:hypothetical protein
MIEIVGAIAAFAVAVLIVGWAIAIIVKDWLNR